MKFCNTHWEKLRAAIEERGLTPLVSDGGASVAEKMADAGGTGLRLDNFDPLMGAHNKIVEHALGAVGLALFQPNDDGSPRCPICYLTALHQAQCRDPKCGQDFEAWINFAADGSKRFVDEQLAAGNSTQ